MGWVTERVLVQGKDEYQEYEIHFGARDKMGLIPRASFCAKVVSG